MYPRDRTKRAFELYSIYIRSLLHFTGLPSHFRWILEAVALHLHRFDVFPNSTMAIQVHLASGFFLCWRFHLTECMLRRSLRKLLIFWCLCYLQLVELERFYCHPPAIPQLEGTSYKVSVIIRCLSWRGENFLGTVANKSPMDEVANEQQQWSTVCVVQGRW